MSRFSDKTVRLRDVFGAQGDELDEAVLAEETDIARITIVEKFLRARQPKADENVPKLSALVYDIANDRGILKVQDLVDRCNLNQRTLQRLFASM